MVERRRFGEVHISSVSAEIAHHAAPRGVVVGDIQSSTGAFFPVKILVVGIAVTVVIGVVSGAVAIKRVVVAIPFVDISAVNLHELPSSGDVAKPAVFVFTTIK